MSADGNRIQGLRRILAPVDFSEASRRGLRQAAAIAEQFRAALTVVHVVPTTLPAEWSHLGVVFEQMRMVANAKRHIAQLCASELPAGLPAKPIVLEGDPVHAIVQTASKCSIDLIVMCTHGYSGLKRLWLGRTAERIVRHALCPELTIRDMALPVAGDGKWDFKRLLVPMDFSSGSRKALRYALTFAKFGNPEVVLLHVIEPPAYPRFGYAHVPAKERKLAVMAAEELDLLRKEVEQTGACCTTLVRNGVAFGEIEDEIARDRTDLVVIGSRGHTGLPRVFLGSTAERVVSHSRVPVLVVRKKERDFVDVAETKTVHP